MSDKLSDYIGCFIKIRCDKFFCSGEIVSLDQNTVVITESRINEIKTTTKYLGINHTLILDMDIIKFPSDKEMSMCSLDITSALNVYTSAIQPPVIKRGGSSSAVHRHSAGTNNSQENIHKSKSSIFSGYNVQTKAFGTETIPKEEKNELSKNDVHKSKSFNMHPERFRTRKTSVCSINKEPSWNNYTFNDTDPEFDFDSNLALFNKNAFTIRNYRKNSNSSNFGELSVVSNNNNEVNVTNIESKDYPPRGDEIQNFFINKINPSNESTNKSKVILTKTMNANSKLNETKPLSESNVSLNVYNELRRMGITPKNSSETLKELTKKTSNKETPNKTCNKETQMSTENILMDLSFLRQPDIVQEVTKSQLCNSDLLIPEQSNILFVDTTNHNFQYFSNFWKLDNDSKFPILTMSQKDKILECANKFGYDVREIADHVGKYLSEFVIQQVGGATRLNRLNVSQIPKIAVLLSHSQTSVFVASMARYLISSGCYVIVYLDDISFKSNEDVATEIERLKNAFSKFSGIYGFNFLTLEAKDLNKQVFDYVISGLENDSKSCEPDEDLINWCFKQTCPILIVNPPNISAIPWKIAAFTGVPTTCAQNLEIRTQYKCENGYLKPRSDGVNGLEIEKLVKKSDGLVFLFNINLPQAVYKLLSLNYKSPFSSKNWIRLYRDNDLLSVE